MRRRPRSSRARWLIQASLRLGRCSNSDRRRQQRILFQIKIRDDTGRSVAADARRQPQAESRMRSSRGRHAHDEPRRTFDAVFVHDAIAYMTSAADLSAAIRTAYRHCRVGGIALFVPDCVRETFVAETKHGGHDGDDGRSLRYLMWVVDPDPTDTTYRTDFAILLREQSRRHARRARLAHRGRFPARRMDTAVVRSWIRAARLDRPMGPRNLCREASPLRSAARFQRPEPLPHHLSKSSPLLSSSEISFVRTTGT